ncbi:MAG: hypothetical protein ACI9HJ_001843, partial [Ulvibacter sp.]
NNAIVSWPFRTESIIASCLDLKEENPQYFSRIWTGVFKILFSVYPR